MTLNSKGHMYSLHQELYFIEIDFIYARYILVLVELIILKKFIKFTILF